MKLMSKKDVPKMDSLVTQLASVKLNSIMKLRAISVMKYCAS